MFYQPFMDGWVDAVYDMRAKARGDDRSPDNRDLTLSYYAKRGEGYGSADYLAIYLAAYNTVERGYLPPRPRVWGTEGPGDALPERFDLHRLGGLPPVEGGDAR